VERRLLKWRLTTRKWRPAAALAKAGHSIAVILRIRA
jgi:hypothetical protein